MTAPDPQQVAEIAGRLSKWERRAWAFGHWNINVHLHGWIDAGLVQPEDGYMCSLTPLGLALRDFIQGTHHD